MLARFPSGASTALCNASFFVEALFFGAKMFSPNFPPSAPKGLSASCFHFAGHQVYTASGSLSPLRQGLVAGFYRNFPSSTLSGCTPSARYIRPATLASHVMFPFLLALISSLFPCQSLVLGYTSVGRRCLAGAVGCWIQYWRVASRDYLSLARIKCLLFSFDIVFITFSSSWFWIILWK